MAIAGAPRSMLSSFSAIRPEGVPDQDRLGEQATDNLRLVVGDVVDSLVGDAVRVWHGGLAHGVGVAGLGMALGSGMTG